VNNTLDPIPFTATNATSATDSLETEEARTLYAWMQTFPQPSIDKLRQINAGARSAKHVLLALAYGATDRHVGSVNRLIVSLLVSRMKAESRQELLRIARIQETLTALHTAIDAITGVPAYAMLSKEKDAPCRKPIRAKFKDVLSA